MNPEKVCAIKTEPNEKPIGLLEIKTEEAKAADCLEE